MSREANVTPAAAARVKRYLTAKRVAWDHHGLAPKERYIDIGTPAGRLRVREKMRASVDKPKGVQEATD